MNKKMNKISGSVAIPRPLRWRDENRGRTESTLNNTAVSRSRNVTLQIVHHAQRIGDGDELFRVTVANLRAARLAFQLRQVG